MGANQIDKASRLKNGAPLHYMLQNVRHSYPNIKFMYTSTKEIEKIIKSLKKMHRDTMKFQLKFSNGVLLLLVPPTYIFSKSLEFGSFPSRLKYSTVIPLFRTGDRLNMSNFRPISLLISFSKIFRKLFIQEFMHM